LSGFNRFTKKWRSPPLPLGEGTGAETAAHHGDAPPISLT
jgi:hypothetical protein